MAAKTPEEEAWAQLETHARWSTGFWLGYVFAGDRAAAMGAVERLDGLYAGSEERPRGLHVGRPEELPGAGGFILEAEGAAAPLVWIEAAHADPPEAKGPAAAWARGWTALIRRLNEHRDDLRAHLCGGLVLIAPLALKAEIRRAGPDLWSVRTVVLEVRRARGEIDEEVALRREELDRRQLLSWGELRELEELAQRAGLADLERRPLLLVGLLTYEAALPHCQRPSEQLWSDLVNLARVGPLDGTSEPPLAVWLENAARLVEGRKEAGRLRDWRDTVRARASREAQETDAGMAYDFFIAYPPTERRAARELYDALTARGHRVFLDEAVLEPGAAWDIEVPRAQRSAHITVVLLSPRAELEWYERDEVAAAITRARRQPEVATVPLYLPGYDGGAPSGLTRPQGVTFKRSMSRAAEELEGLLPDARRERS